MGVSLVTEPKRHEKSETAQTRIVPSNEQPCIWMLAGVLSCWLCDRDLQCETCPLDAALSHDSQRKLRRGKRRPRVAAESRQRQATAPPTKPVVPEQGSTSGRDLTEIVSADLEQLDAQCSYAKAHTWARVESESHVRVGVDPFVARISGSLRLAVLLPVGTQVWKGRPCAWLDQPGGTLTLRSPISGIVRERNQQLCQRSDFSLEDPFGEDWLYLVQPLRLRTEERLLLDAPSFQSVVQEDFGSWQRLVFDSIEGDTGPVGRTLADGGVQVHDLMELLGEARLHEIATRFLS